MIPLIDRCLVHTVVFLYGDKKGEDHILPCTLLAVDGDRGKHERSIEFRCGSKEAFECGCQESA